MEIFNYKGYIVTYFMQGNDKNGNKIYCLQIFFKANNNYVNITHKLSNLYNKKTDKIGNFKTQNLCNSIENTIKWYIDEYENEQDSGVFYNIEE